MTMKVAQRLLCTLGLAAVAACSPDGLIERSEPALVTPPPTLPLTSDGMVRMLVEAASSPAIVETPVLIQVWNHCGPAEAIVDFDGSLWRFTTLPVPGILVDPVDAGMAVLEVDGNGRYVSERGSIIALERMGSSAALAACY